MPVVQRLCSSLALELEALDRVAREDLADLEQAIRQFAAEEAGDGWGWQGMAVCPQELQFWEILIDFGKLEVG